jgi:hypothetical protein
MLNDSRLNVYIQAAESSSRLRQRIQAQVETALRSVPRWAFDLMARRMDESGFRNAALIVEPVHSGADARCISFGTIDGRPAVRLLPRLANDGIEWGQDRRLLLAKAIAYLSSPPADAQFWDDWQQAIHSDALRTKARELHDAWAEATDLELFLELLAAYLVNPEHSRWTTLPATISCLNAWRGASA